MKFAWGLVLLVGCGRIGFDPSTGDGGVDTSDGTTATCVPGGALTLTDTGGSLGGAAHAHAPFAVTSDGLAAAWPDLRSGGFSKIHTARFGFDGARIGSDVRVVASTINETTPAIATVPTGLAVSWREEPSGAWRIAVVDGASVGPVGPVSDQPTSSVSYVGLLATSNRLLGVSTQDRGGTAQMYLSTLDLDAVKIGTDINISLQPGIPELVLDAVVHDGELAVLYFHNAIDALRIGRRTFAGQAIGVDAIVSPLLGGLIDGGLVWADGRYAVTWSTFDSSYTIHAAFLDASLQPLGNAVIETSATPNSAPDIAYLGNGVFGIAWDVNNVGFAFERIGSDGQVRGSRETGGSVMTSNVALSAAPVGAVLSWQDAFGGAVKYQLVCP